MYTRAKPFVSGSRRAPSRTQSAPRQVPRPCHSRGRRLTDDASSTRRRPPPRRGRRARRRYAELVHLVRKRSSQPPVLFGVRRASRGRAAPRRTLTRVAISPRAARASYRRRTVRAKRARGNISAPAERSLARATRHGGEHLRGCCCGCSGIGFRSSLAVIGRRGISPTRRRLITLYPRRPTRKRRTCPLGACGHMNDSQLSEPLRSHDF
jgi:hypothetical protein